jgi:hypothetical protein
MAFDYQAEKLGEARSSLMASNQSSGGSEVEALADAFFSCSQGLHQLDVAAVGEAVRPWLAVVESALDTTGLDDPSGLGVWTVKAALMSPGEKREFKQAVDMLAAWFSKSKSAPGVRRR